MKKCTKCLRELNYDNFGQDRQKKGGISSCCKECCKNRARAYRQANPEKSKESARASAEKTRELRNARAREKRKADPDRARARDRDLYARGGEHSRKRNRDSYYRHREARLADSARWRAENPDRYASMQREYYRANRDSLLEGYRAYYQANKDKFLGYSRARAAAAKPSFIRAGAIDSAKRRAAKRSAIPAWFCAESCKKIYAKAETLTRVTGVKHEVDHIVPILSDLVCGLHWHGNMQVITKAENAAKGNRHWPDMP